jgi:flagellar protein FliO/FliZ
MVFFTHIGRGSFFESLLTINNEPAMNVVGRFLYIVVLVLFVVLLAYFTTKLLVAARSGRLRSTKRDLEVIESIGVSQQAWVSIIRAGSRYILLGITKENITLLSELDKETLTLHSGSTPQVPFTDVFKRLLHRNKEAEPVEKDKSHES